ncbi:MAG TPA: carboxypeptidase regulatory-like domain-containing protein [Thermoanaerobaculia bacterium]|jgi:hypothetical protein
MTSLLFALFAVLAEPAAERGTFCLGESAKTFTSERARCAVESFPDERLGVAVAGDGKRALLGVVPAGKTEIRRDGMMTVAIGFRTSSRHWPASTRITIVAADQRWEWQLEGDAAARLQSIELPRQSYQITVQAAHHDPLEVRLDPAPKPVLLLHLAPLPVVSGRVVGPNGPIAGVLIALPDGKTLALTDFNGEFREELPAGDHPAAVVVSYGGYGSRRIPIPAQRADVVLPIVQLSPAGKLAVRIERDTERIPELAVAIGRREGRKTTEVQRATIDRDTVEWRLEDLEQGTYVVTASGSAPLQQYATEAKIVAGEEAAVTLEIAPIAVRGNVVRGQAGIAKATIHLRSSHYGWSGALTSGDDGSFEGEMWQVGRFGVSVTAPGLSGPFGFAHELDRAEAENWQIRIPGGSIAGVVVDRRTKQPVRQAEITLDSVSADSSRSLGTASDDNGRFQFEGIAGGTHTLQVEAKGYLIQRVDPFVFVSDADTKDVQVMLMRATERAVSVFTPSAAPIAGAAVLHAELPESGVPMTDMTGRAYVPAEPGRATPILVLPREGSFALTIIPADATTDAPLRVVIPPGSASLHISTRNETTGAPVTNVQILLRYNGQFLTPPMARVMSRVRGISTQTDARGELFLANVPPGTYELWPYVRADEAMRIMERGLPAVAVIGASAGTYQATIHFTDRSAIPATP